MSCTGVYSSAKIVFCLFSFPDMKGVTRKPPLFPPPPPTFPSVSASKKNSLFQPCTMIESLDNFNKECRNSVVGDVAIMSLIETSIVA